MPHALVVEDDGASLEAMSELVERDGFSVAVARSLEEARERIKERVPDVALVDLFLPDGSGMEFLRDEIQERAFEIVVVTGHGAVDSAVEALRLGALDYLTKPVDVPRLRAVLTNVVRSRELREEIGSLRGKLRELGRFGRLVGVSAPMQALFDLVVRVAPTDATVFLTGESGTGKELVAQTIHDLSKRRKAPFLPVNCGAIPANLIESELFGHEQGSFTGASRQHRGYFERAAGGTLFLDEIAEMPIELQVKLLRVLETGSLVRIGGERELRVDVRVIAATNRRPELALQEGKLREDLLYRLKVFPVDLPRLEEREDDVVLLAEFFLESLNKQHGLRKRLSEAATARLRMHSWPGNVRELKHVIERAFILAEEEIGPELLLLSAQALDRARATGGPHLQVKIGSTIAEAERRLILATLDHFGGNKVKAAGALGISLKTLYNRLNSYKAQG